MQFGLHVTLESDKNAAIADFRNALEVNPTFNDAKVALESIGVKP
jgi:hypothetical protein